MENKDEQKPVTLPADLIINPDGTATYTMNEDGPILGSYRGIFVLKCYLNPLDNLAASKAMRELIGPFGELATEQDRYTAFCLSQLQKRVIKSPPWWNFGDVNTAGNVPDLNILSTLLDRALTAEAAYKQHLVKKKEEALAKAEQAVQKLQENLKPKKED